MKIDIKTISKLLFASAFSLFFISCEEEKLGPSIFVDTELDPNSASYEFDCWLDENFKKPYNLAFRYRMKDIEVDRNYNLSPIRMDKAKDMVQLIDYLWLDVYSDIVGQEFLKENSPRIMQLVGSLAFNVASRTQTQGLAEGGIKVTLYGCNELNFKDMAKMNDNYFITMHHEFCHILHQKKAYSQEFPLISAGKYDPNAWNERTDAQARSLGFVSPYGSSEPQEDFVEVFARYLIMTDAEWENLLLVASKNTTGLNSNEVVDDGVDGRAIILQKLDMVKTWCKTSWNMDIDKLRKEILTRQAIVANTGGIPEY